MSEPKQEPAGPVAKHVRVHGRVQGVFFRASCVDQARQAGVHGWVRNEPDGTVRAHLEGETAAVERLVRWCHEGPAHAEVSSVESQGAAVAGFEGFEQRG